MSTNLRAIDKPAPWATTLDQLHLAELPRTDWSKAQTCIAPAPLPTPEVLPDEPPPAQRLAFQCSCGASFAHIKGLIDHVLSGHTQHGLTNPDRAAARRAYHAEHGRASRAKKKGIPTPPARPKVAPDPPATREHRRQPATVLAPTPAEDATLARARARIAARHGVTPCIVCGTAKGVRVGCGDKPYRDRMGRCGACSEANLLRSQLGSMGR